MGIRITTCAAIIGAAGLAACSGGGGGGGGGSGNDGPTTGIADPGDITGANPDYINSLANQLAIVNSPIVRAGRTEIPLSGTATYAGFGSIYDSSVTSADTTAARLRGRSVVTDVAGTATFGASPSVSITQSNFRDVDGNPVSGTVTWTTGSQSEGLFRSTVNGNVGGTVFATGTDQARIGFFGNQSDSAVLGTFSDAPVSASGALQGSRISGDFSAERTGP